MNSLKLVGTNTSSHQNFTLILSSILFIFLFFTNSKSSFADTIIPGGNITANTTWTLAGNPYIVQGNVTVVSGVALTIEPGVQVKFSGYYQLEIAGSLVADGTAQNRIYFLSNLSNPNRNSWHRVYLNGSNSALQISYWTVQHATFGIYFNGASPAISQSIFTQNGNGFWMINSSSPSVTASQFYNNDSGIMIEHVASDPHPTVTESSFHDNDFWNVTHNGIFSNPSLLYDFTNNWWGTTSQSTIASRITDHSEQPYYPTIDFIPFLDSENGNPYLAIDNISRSPAAIDHKVGGTTTIYYSLATDATVTVEIHKSDNPFTHAKYLAFQQFQTAGDHSLVWDGRNDAGQLVDYAFYTFQIDATNGSQTQSFRDEFSGNNFCITSANIEHANFDPFKNERMLLHIDVLYPGVQPVYIRQGLQDYRDLTAGKFLAPGDSLLDWDGRTYTGQMFSGDFDNILIAIPGLYTPQAIVLRNSTAPPNNFSSEAYLILPPQGEVSTLTYSLSAQSLTSVIVKDPNGNHFRTLLNQTNQAPGSYSLLWDGQNDLGEYASTEGSYRVQVKAVNPVSGEYAQIVGSVMVYQ